MQQGLSVHKSVAVGTLLKNKFMVYAMATVTRRKLQGVNLTIPTGRLERDSAERAFSTRNVNRRHLFVSPFFFPPVYSRHEDPSIGMMITTQLGNITPL